MSSDIAMILQVLQKQTAVKQPTCHTGKPDTETEGWPDVSLVLSYKAQTIYFILVTLIKLT